MCMRVLVVIAPGGAGAAVESAVVWSFATRFSERRVGAADELHHEWRYANVMRSYKWSVLNYLCQVLSPAYMNNI